MFKKNRMEIIIFLFCFTIYYCIGIFTALRTMVIDHPQNMYDIYLSYDNPFILYNVFAFKGGYISEVRHPLMKLLTMPFTVIGTSLMALIAYKAKTLFFVFVTATMTALSSAFIYRYLDRIVEEKIYFRKIIPTLMFSFFSNNLIISFTPESYPFSLFLLILVTYYYSSCIKENKSVSTRKIMVLSVLTSGFTITNIFKCISPILFTNSRKRIFKMSKIGLFIVLALLGYLFLASAGRHILLKIIHRPSAYINPISDALYLFTTFRGKGSLRFDDLFPYSDAVITCFFGSPLIFPTLSVEKISLDASHLPYAQLWAMPYSSWLQYAVLAIFAVIVILSVIINRKNNITRFILLNFAFDIFLHVILGWAIYESTIFGSHWVFIVPMLIGWLYRTLAETHKKVLDVIITSIFLFIIVNNTSGMSEFFMFALKYYGI